MQRFLRDLAFVLSRAFFIGERLNDGELPKENPSSVGVLTSLGITGSFPLLRAIGCIAQPLSRTSFPRSWLFLSRPATSHSHAASVQHDLATPSSVLLVPPVFCPSLDTN